MHEIEEKKMLFKEIAQNFINLDPKKKKKEG